MHDGNKNVTDVIAANTVATQLAHYDYAPFGAVRAQSGSRAAANPYRFSSEFADDTLGLVYYNYRHYEPATGRWHTFDVFGENGGLNLYGFIQNDALRQCDVLGNRRSSTLGIVLDDLCEYAYNYARRQLETQQEIQAWDRYTNHGPREKDRDITLTPSEVRDISESIADVVAFVNSKRCACKGNLTISDSKSIGGTAPSPWVGAIGGVSVEVVTHCSNGSFSFEYHINDLYDFDIKWFATSRTISGELKTIAVNWTQFCLQCNWKSFYHKGSYDGK